MAVGGTLLGVTSISAGANHNLAVISDETAVSWGENDYGQLGNDTVSDRFAPVIVQK